MKTEQILAEGARRQEGENGPQWEGQIEHMEWVERWRDWCSEARDGRGVRGVSQRYGRQWGQVVRVLVG